MISALSLGFTEPLVLTGLITLPALWWLLRLIPPRPRRIDFPPTRLLFAIVPREETPARTPWWLTLLRLALAAMIIIAAAGPLWHPPVAATKTHAPLAILFDDGWTAASTWEARLRTADDIVMRAADDRRAVALLPLSQGARDISLETADSARVRLQQIKPVPYRVDRAETLPSLSRFLSTNPEIELVWLSDGIDLGNGAAFVTNLEQTVGQHPLTIVTGGIPQPRALNGAENAAGALTVKVLRATPGANDTGTVRALDLKGLALGEAQFTFKAADRETEARFELPVELRNEITRLEIAGERSAGAVQLLDKRSRRRTVGVVSGANADVAEPLLSSSYYLQRALEPFADVRLAQGELPADAVSHFLDQNLPMLVLTDVGNVGDAHDRLARWVEDGGVLVRFAGPRLAASEDDLVPVRLRRGGRILGGSLSWDKPQPLAAFSRDSPFGGLPVPDDVTVTRQVLAEPDATLGDNTWATLADGTPLVTAAHRGKGLLVLFHVTGDTRWSDLPLSGAFVDMLKRIVALSGTTVAPRERPQQARMRTPSPRPAICWMASAASSRRRRQHDRYRRILPAAPRATIRRDFMDHLRASWPSTRWRAAIASPRLIFRRSPMPVVKSTAPANRRICAARSCLRPSRCCCSNSIIVLFLGGGIQRLIPRRLPAVSTSILVVAALTLTCASAYAQQSPTDAPQAALETKLAYVITGNADVDAISKAGLSGLTLFLAQRTALEPGDPIGLDIARDELVFYPLIYWPIVPGAPRPSEAALKRIDAYMKDGGTVLFDTRDALVAPAGQGGETRSPGMLELRKILSSLDIPELEPVPRDHVLTKTFYLLRDFPGRFDGGQLWVEALPSESEQEASGRPARGGDGVSSIIITSNDFAGAWATRPDGQPVLPMVDGQPRQRELAFRAGVNIVMYTLTGNYKADQVHVPALLERLGQ